MENIFSSFAKTVASSLLENEPTQPGGATLLQPTIGAHRLSFVPVWLSRRSRLSVKPLGDETTWRPRSEVQND